MPRCLTPAELAAGAGAEPLLTEDGAVADPLLGLDLDAAPHPGAAAAALRCDRVLVGVSSHRTPHPDPGLLAALDLSLVPAGGPDPVPVTALDVADPHTELAALAVVAQREPGAVHVLRGLLRAAAAGVRAGLDAESLAYSTLLGGAGFRRWLAGRGPRPLPPVVEDPVLLRRDGGVLEIELNRPARRNAYGRQVRDALVDGLRVAHADPGVERVVLTGAGPAFCSGGDLDEFGTAPDPVTAHLVRTRGGAGVLLAEVAERVEVRVHGACVGAGIEVPAFAGTVLAAPGTTFRLPEIGMGLIPGAGGTVSIPARIGRWRTLHLALSGTAIDVERACGWGLVDGRWDGPSA